MLAYASPAIGVGRASRGAKSRGPALPNRASVYDSGETGSKKTNDAFKYTRLPVRSKPDVVGSGTRGSRKETAEAITAVCRECGAGFGICRSCWRGQVYCSRVCRDAGKRRLHRQAQRRYRQTETGKAAHREAERRRRRIHEPMRPVGRAGQPSTGKAPEPQRSENQQRPWASREKTMADASSNKPVVGPRIGGRNTNPPATRAEKISTKWVACHFCGEKGVVVARFRRRGYGCVIGEAW